MRVSIQTAYGGLVTAFQKSFKQMAGNVPEPIVIAKLIKKGIEASNPKTRYVGGYMAKPMLFLRKIWSDKMLERIIMSQIKRCILKLMQEEQINPNIILYACEGESHFGHDPFVYKHSIGIITSGSADHYTGQDVVNYPTGSLCLLRRNQLLKVIKKPNEQNHLLRLLFS